MKVIIRLFTLALMLTTALAMSAARKPKAKDPGYIGIRVAYDYNSCTKSYGFVKPGSGFSVGASYQTPIAPRFYFSPSVMFAYDRFTLDGHRFGNPLKQDIKGDMYTYGARIPLDFGFNFINKEKVKISVYTGPQLYFSFVFKSVYDLIYPDSSRHYDEKVVTSGLELCWTGGLAAEIHRHWRIQAGYLVGLSKMGLSDGMAMTRVSFRRSQLTIGLGYNF